MTNSKSRGSRAGVQGVTSLVYRAAEADTGGGFMTTEHPSCA